MAYEMLISERANFQIDRLAAYLLTVLNNRQACIHFFDELQKTYEMLRTDPFCCKPCSEKLLAQKGYRSAQLPTMRYRIVYRVEENKIYIVAVFHTLENYSRKL